MGEIGGIIPFRFSIPVKFENDLRRLSHSDKKRVKAFMSMLNGHSIWRMAEFYNEMMFRLPAVRQAQEHAENGGNAYMYYWTVPSSMPFRGACHAVELAYVFGNLDCTIYTGDNPNQEVSDAVMDMWVNFAKSGNPSTENIEWKPYDKSKRNTMIISDTPHIERDVLSEQRELLYPLLDYMFNASYTSLDLNVPFVRRAIVGGAALVAGITGAAVMIKRSLNKK